MPLNPTYPGVYVQEISSGVRTIVGVPTSVTAFVGRAVKGPVDEPSMVTSFADFERNFGGLHLEYPLSYAVKDFFNNGGSQALIVRLYLSAVQPATTPPTESVDDVPTPAPAPAADGHARVATPVALKAVSPGSWANGLNATVDHDGISDDVVKRFQPAGGSLEVKHFFNLRIHDKPNNNVDEYFRAVSLHKDAGTQRLDYILETRSTTVRYDGDLKESDAERPDATDSNNPAKLGNGQASMQLTANAFIGSENDQTGLYALLKTDIFNLLCIPPDRLNGDVEKSVWQKGMEICQKQRAMLIVDAPADWSGNVAEAAKRAKEGLSTLGLTGVAARNAALFFPRIRQPNPLFNNRVESFVPSGAVAGIMARTDVQRGVWKAPAGTDAAIMGIEGLDVNLNDDANGQLNPLGINCLRDFPQIGPVVWGSRTLRGADILSDEYKYIPVRRLALFLEESLYRGTQWVVFEPNDEPLWSQIRLNVGAFMHDLFRQGAFQGSTPKEAYFVRCDHTTTTQSDINKGIVNIIIGFAPLKPAEFVILTFQQMAGQISS